MIDPQEETYAEVCKLIYKLCWDNICCCQFEERLSTAHIAFMRAYRLYRPSRGAFSTYLTHAIRNEFKTQCTACNRQRKHQTYNNCSEVLADVSKKDTACLSDVWRDYSSDAQEVAKIILESPEEVIRSILFSYNIWKKLSSHLKSLGWDKVRISTTINELIKGQSQ